MKISTHNNLKGIAPKEWNCLIGENNPFLEYDFFRSLERSSSVGRQSGWVPHFVTVEENQKIVGAVPLYWKDNSYGEYIFDWNWSYIYQQIGLPYFPKLVVAVPYTPATGNRLLVHPEANYEKVSDCLISAVLEEAQNKKVSSLHWLFTLPKEMKYLEKKGAMSRYTHQFHWYNKGYKTFSDYLGEFKAKKRNQVKRERRRGQEGVEIQILEGKHIQNEHWEAMYTFYQQTTYQKYAQAYLKKSFFEDIAKKMSSYTVLALAKRKGSSQYIAGSLSFRKNNHLYGRYWGGCDEQNCLHFELCYYALIEYAIKENIQLFEAGAQGEHKISRGFLPQHTYSAHWIFHPLLKKIIQEYIDQETEAINDIMGEYKRLSPFKLSEK